MMTRRAFGKACGGAVVLLGIPHGPGVLAAGEGGPRGLAITDTDDQSRAFVEGLQGPAMGPGQALAFDGSPAHIAALRRQLVLVGEGIGEGGVVVAGLVGAHAYPVLETLLRDAGAALLVRGLHVLRRGYERHVFLTTPAGQGAGDVFRAILPADLAPDAVREHRVGTARGPRPVAPPAGRVEDRILALARAYATVLYSHHPAWPAPPPPRAGSGRLNHESFVFRLGPAAAGAPTRG